METQKLILTFFCSIFLLIGYSSSLVQSPHDNQHHNHHHPRPRPRPRRFATKLFVFGDSYADTGNRKKSDSRSWNQPYGITFPGRPTGRFSDGLVFTDFLARSLGVRPPVAYNWSKFKASQLKFGMNFAFGGTGVFNTSAPYPNMTTQIDIFEKLLKQSYIRPWELEQSVAHVSVAGNDYSEFMSKGGSVGDIIEFIGKVVEQLAKDLQRINKLGVKKVSITSLLPLGCVPEVTFQTKFKECNDTFNTAVELHNQLLQGEIDKLNNQTDNAFVIIDLYTAFSSILKPTKSQQQRQGNLKFKNPLEPCCFGLNHTYYCGNVDSKGNKMYTVCKDRRSHFFWDTVHPTDSGWLAVTSALKPTLEELHYF